MMMRPLAVTAMLLAGTTLQAETLSVVGSWSGLPLHKNYEQPFWTEKLPAAAVERRKNPGR